MWGHICDHVIMRAHICNHAIMWTHIYDHVFMWSHMCDLVIMLSHIGDHVIIRGPYLWSCDHLGVYLWSYVMWLHIYDHMLCWCISVIICNMATCLWSCGKCHYLNHTTFGDLLLWYVIMWEVVFVWTSNTLTSLTNVFKNEKRNILDF